MADEFVLKMLPQWTANGRNMIPHQFRNHPDVLSYLAGNKQPASVFYECSSK